MIYTEYDYNRIIKKQFDIIEDVVDYFIRRNIKVNLTDFIKFINMKFYPEIDISFMNYSLKICMKKDEFCVNPIEEFKNLKVKDNEITSSNLLITMKSSGLVEDIDYKLILHAQG
jgi:hypothetical protein